MIVMHRSAKIFYQNHLAGLLYEVENGYCFKYSKTYLNLSDAMPVSLSLPLSPGTYHREKLFAFFDGLIPEG